VRPLWPPPMTITSYFCIALLLERRDYELKARGVLPARQRIAPIAATSHYSVACVTALRSHASGFTTMRSSTRVMPGADQAASTG